MWATISDSIRISLGDLPTEVRLAIERQLTIANPAKSVAQREMLWGADRLDDHLRLYSHDGGEVVLPVGFRHALVAGLAHYGLAVEWRDLRSRGTPLPDARSAIMLRDYQEPMCAALLDGQCGVVEAPTAAGKGHPSGTIVPTPRGFCLWGDLQIGDCVFSRDGQPTRIVSTHDRGYLPVYEVTFSDHTKILCDGDHLWHVSDRVHRRASDGGWRTLSVTQLLEMGVVCEEGYRWKIPIGDAVQFNQVELPIDPYLVGSLIANGGLTSRSSTYLTTPDSEVIDRIRRRVAGTILLNKINDKTDGVCDRYSIPGILNSTRILGMRVRSCEKRIPKDYLMSSIEDRVELLRGLMDGDGSSSDGRRSARYHTTSRGLADDVAELVCSLGGTASVNIRKRHDEKPIEYPVQINPPLWLDMWGTGRKRPQNTSDRLPPLRSIISIKRVEDDSISCITVEAEDGLYMIGRSYVVTHNTAVALEAIRRAGLSALVIVDRSSLARQWMDAVQRFLGLDCGYVGEGGTRLGPITICLRQAVWAQREQLWADGFFQAWGTVVVDECHRSATAQSLIDVVQRFNSLNRWGVSATPDRDPAYFPVLQAVVGPVLWETTMADASEHLVVPRVRVLESSFEFPEYHPTRQLIDEETGRRVVERNNYAAMMSALERDHRRNLMIATTAALEQRAGHHVLVVSRRRRHLEAIHALLDSRGLVFMLTGKDKGSRAGEVAAEIAGYDTGTILLSTVAEEGLDIPRLDRVVIAFPGRNPETFRQIAGRVMRPAPGKVDAVVIDVRDGEQPLLRSQYRERSQLLYGKEGWLVERG